ncbi:GGDEF domain-containing protein [Neiella marina]|uniref:diguanylate cyclase n=1 Tax=Neiella holothuriorum TaxID=2870530 RepID=A0ABS7EGV9_9GAMM|nr:GGDEF domain-containing protein [Neiella holothuriorum]MBW8191560.1 GGDEF domain-containing protein [Neiella holothuriorum]
MFHVLPFIWPLLVTVSVIWISQISHVWSPDQLSILRSIPYLLAGLLVVLSVPFRQGRVAITALLFAAIYYVIQQWLQQPLDILFTQKVFVLLAVAIPFNLIAISFCNEQPPVSPLGMMAIAIGLAQLLLGYLLVQHEASLESWLTSWLAIKPVAWAWQPTLALVFAVAGVVGLVVKFHYQRHALDLDLAVSLIIASWMLANFERDHVSALAIIGMLLLLCRSFLASSYQMAFFDELTQLPGRRAMVSDLKHASRSYSMAMTDVDHFKKFNDTYGHDTGDDVLKLVAAKLSKVTGGGKAYRFGGEEFAIVFRGKSPAACKAHLEALREEIAHYDLVVRDAKARPDDHNLGRQRRGAKPKKIKTTNVTISLGLAQRQQGEPYESVMKRADQALYRAKDNGRNRLEVADD